MFEIEIRQRRETMVVSEASQTGDRLVRPGALKMAKITTRLAAIVEQGSCSKQVVLDNPSRVVAGKLASGSYQSPCHLTQHSREPLLARV